MKSSTQPEHRFHTLIIRIRHVLKTSIDVKHVLSIENQVFPNPRNTIYPWNIAAEVYMCNGVRIPDIVWLKKRLASEKWNMEYGNYAFDPPERMVEYYRKAYLEAHEIRAKYLQDNNFVVATFITRRDSVQNRIIEMIEKLGFVSQISISHESLMSCRESFPWRIFPRLEESDFRFCFENDRVCFLPANKRLLDDSSLNYGDWRCAKAPEEKEETMRKLLVKYFWPKIKKLVDNCSCVKYLRCVTGIVLWDCKYGRGCSCLKSKCLTREKALAILREQKMETDQTEEESSSDTSIDTDSSTASSENESSNEEDELYKFSS